MPGDRGEHRDQLVQIAAQERLAAGQTDLVDAERGCGPRDARDLLEAQELARGRNAWSGPKSSLGMQ